MKHKTPGVTDELLNQAKAEFLEVGYRDASLRRIAEAANVSTNSIYSRFGSKEGLFDAVVRDVATEFESMLGDMNRIVEDNYSPEDTMDMSDRYTMSTLDYIYDHFDVFKLIFCRSYGTGYEHYVEKLASNEEASTRYYVRSLGIQEDISDLFISVVCRAGYQYLRAVVENDLSREKAHLFMKQILRFQNAGWKEILGQ